MTELTASRLCRDGTVSKYTYMQEHCVGPEQNDIQVTHNLLQAIGQAENAQFNLDRLPPGAVTILAPADHLNTNQCYEEFSLDLSSVAPDQTKPISLSTKYTSLGECAPAIAGAGWVEAVDYDNADCTKKSTGAAEAAVGIGKSTGKGGKGRGGKGGAGGDAANRIAVQFGICYMDPDFQNLVDDPTTEFDETTIGDYLPAYAKVECNTDGSITTQQYFDPNCRGAEADEGSKIRELLEAQVAAETGLPQSVINQAGDFFIQLPVPDTMTNGQCVVEADVSLSKLTGNPSDDYVKATKWSFGGCAAATTDLGAVESQDFSSLNCRDGYDHDHTLARHPCFYSSLRCEMYVWVCTDQCGVGAGRAWTRRSP